MSLDSIDISAISEAKAIRQIRSYEPTHFNRQPKVKVSGAFSLIPRIIKTNLGARKMSRASVPENETKVGKFKRLGSAYTAKALHRIRLVGNLSARTNYEYTPEQVQKIEQALYTAVEETMAKFNEAKIATGFSL